MWKLLYCCQITCALISTWFNYFLFSFLKCWVQGYVESLHYDWVLHFPVNTWRNRFFNRFYWAFNWMLFNWWFRLLESKWIESFIRWHLNFFIFYHFFQIYDGVRGKVLFLDNFTVGSIFFFWLYWIKANSLKISIFGFKSFLIERYIVIFVRLCWRQHLWQDCLIILQRRV